MLYNIFMFVMPFFAVWCFYAGFKLGKTEKIPAPKIETPKQKIEKHKKTKRQEEELNRLNILMKNLEAYDGSAKGQEKVK